MQSSSFGNHGKYSLDFCNLGLFKIRVLIIDSVYECIHVKYVCGMHVWVHIHRVRKRVSCIFPHHFLPYSFWGKVSCWAQTLWFAWGLFCFVCCLCSARLEANGHQASCCLNPISALICTVFNCALIAITGPHRACGYWNPKSAPHACSGSTLYCWTPSLKPNDFSSVRLRKVNI